MVLVRSIAFFLAMTLVTIVFSLPAAIFSPVISFESSSRVSNAWGKVVLWLLRYICNLRYKIEGWENLPPEGGYVICSKHQSAWETIALRGILPPRQTWILKKQLLKIPFFGWALQKVEPIAIDRSAGFSALKQIVAEGLKALAQGRIVIVFPEGTRVAPGERLKYNVGGALLGEKSGRPIVPIAHNAGVFWGRRGIRKFSGTINLVIGPPIPTVGRKVATINNDIENWIEDAVSKLPRSR